MMVERPSPSNSPPIGVRRKSHGPKRSKGGAKGQVIYHKSAFHPVGQFAELFITRRDGFAQLPVGSLALPEREQVFLTVVAAQSFDDLLGTAAAALVPPHA